MVARASSGLRPHWGIFTTAATIRPMRIVIGLHTLAAEGGMVSYVATIADHLQRAGHDVRVFGRTGGPTAEKLEKIGIRTLVGIDSLPAQTDVFFPQDQPSSLDLLEARPEVPQVFFWHSNLFDINLSPQLPDVVRLLVVLGAREPGRPDALAVKAPVLRLDQPIDTQRFQPEGRIAERPRRAVAIGNYLDGQRREVLIEACRQAGLELELYGAREAQSATDPAAVMNGADIVFGKGRVAMEAMACGRATYVYDSFGCDGWVTSSSFRALMDTGMSGNATTMTAEVDRLVSDLANYDPAMGEINRDLAAATFNATWHVGALIEATEAALADDLPVPSNDSAFELSRLARLAWRHESEAFELRVRMGRVEAEIAAEHARYEQARGEAIEAERRLAAVVNSTRWRTLNLLLKPLDLLRRRS